MVCCPSPRTCLKTPRRAIRCPLRSNSVHLPTGLRSAGPRASPMTSERPSPKIRRLHAKWPRSRRQAPTRSNASRAPSGSSRTMCAISMSGSIMAITYPRPPKTHGRNAMATARPRHCCSYRFSASLEWLPIRRWFQARRETACANLCPAFIRSTMSSFVP